MKKISLPTCLQLIYCFFCTLAIVCMNLYTACYPTQFSNVCFKIGVVITILCALNPIGILCGIWQIVKYAKRSEKDDADHSKQIAWVIIGPILTTLAWYLAIASFVTHSGGV